MLDGLTKWPKVEQRQVTEALKTIKSRDAWKVLITILKSRTPERKKRQ